MHGDILTHKYMQMPQRKAENQPHVQVCDISAFFHIFFWVRGNDGRNIAYPNKNILSAMEFLTITENRKERSSPEKGSLLLDFPFTPLFQVELK